MATIGGMKIATTGSNHIVPGPTPAMSLCPPTPPAGPVPSPFAYIARSATASDTSSKLKVGGDPVLVVGSAMDIQQPGNIPSNPTGGDVVTHMVNRACGVFTGSSKVKAGGKDVACTNDQARLNMPYARGMVAQTIGKLVMADLPRLTTHPGEFAAGQMVILDPISVSTGTVVDETVDLEIRGLIPIAFRRLYSSARVREHTPLGRGGWTHSFHQYIELEGDDLRLREADGSTVTVRGALPRKPAFHRGRRLVLLRDARGGATVFSLDTRLLRTFQPLGGAGGGRAYLTEIVNACGQRVRLEYEAERLARIIDTAGRVVALTHDGAGHVVRLEVFPPEPPPDRPRRGERASLYTVSYAYGDDGGLIGATDARGRTESFAYDGRRLLVQKTLPNRLSFHYAYDDAGRCVRAWGDGGLYSGGLEYDQEKGVTRLVGNPEPRVFTWRADGAVLREATPDGALVQEVKLDEDGLLLEEKNAAGDGISFEYDARGNHVKTVDPLGNVLEQEYENDLLVRRRVNGQLTELSYDYRGLLTHVKYPTGAFLALSYDDHGRLAAVYGPDGPLGAYTYDEQHNVVEERTPRGGVRKWQYDGLGRLVAFTDPHGRVLRRELDALGKPVALHHPDGSVVRMEYDALGRLTRRVDELGRAWTARYAGLKSPVEVVYPDGAAWTFAYDTLERVQQVRNPKGEVFDFRWSRAGWLREVRSFDGRVTRITRGRNHCVSRLDLPDGSWRNYQYDATGAVVAEEAPHGAVTVERTPQKVEYVLDDPAGKQVTTLELDEHGRVVAETQNGRTLRYEHDAKNRCVARHLPTGQVTRFFHDEDGNVSALEHDGYRVELQRDRNGLVVGRVFAGCGVEVRRAVDVRGRVTREWVGTAARTLVDRMFTHDAAGTLVAMNDTRWGSRQYRHDAAGLLVEATSPAGVEAFEYDAAGSIRPAGAAWEIGPGNVLLRTEALEYAHDEGNRRTREARPGGQGATEYFWDCRGRLREVLLPDGARVLMTYDALGRRVRKDVVDPLILPADGGLPEAPPKVRSVEYLWDGNCVVAEIDSERGTRVFVHEPRTMVPLLQQEGGAIHAVITDHHGTPTELIDPSGEVAWSALHSAWGLILKEDRPGGRAAASPFRLLGQYADEETGLCYVRYRYFDPKVARFLSPDPLELAGGANLFAFNGSPTTDVDPLGLACMLIGDPRHDSAINYIVNNRRPMPGLYDIYVHGRHHNMAFQDHNGQWHDMTPQQLMDRIRIAGNYDGTTPILLNSCNTGRTPVGVGQQVSQGMGVTVHAPNDIVWGQAQDIAPPIGIPNSSTHVPTGTVTQVPDPTRRGQWNTWNNGAASPSNSYRPP